MKTLESWKETLRETLSEANVKSGVSGTSLSKLPAKIKRILVDDLKISTYHLSQIYFDKHLKQLMIIVKPMVIDRAAIQKLMDAPEFIYIQYINDVDHTPGLSLVFRYNGGNEKKKQPSAKPGEIKITGVVDHPEFDKFDDDLVD